MSLKIEKGDITKYEVDAIVNAANSSLLGGGGVDGAIHRAAGRRLLEECMTLGGCKTGDAKITKGYDLKAKHVIHTVGPVYYKQSKEQSRKLLESCYVNSIKAAKENKLKSMAFPLISAGVYGYPKKEALEVAISVIKKEAEDLDCVIVLFDIEAWEIAKKEFSELIF
ncbi:MAG: O-acetyl-ADP-ribose deacetylase [Treponema sp.]|uniref:O-acetyl-ADP-ribose deacetylase n=1 Tax=Treponema sp. TaxID=166 RepID=UPI00298EBFA2|nr:O-acetyl-ADP-ribose deacetylase [Treponema sp.]MBR5933369.1 O-acetyl-ADP-ribose deacetylase [Treponema sp.]